MLSVQNIYNNNQIIILYIIVMSSTEADEVCASCGKAAVDDMKLKKCGGCELVKYCSVDCQKNHRPQHKKACKKRAAQLRDNELFAQPDGSCYGECPICCLPLSLDKRKWTMVTCCCKLICQGCNYANQKREREQGQYPKCPYCREPVPKTQEEKDQNLMKRIKANDPVAMCQLGKKCYIKGDFEGAVEYFSKAAAMGEIEALYNLSVMYHEGEGVEKDEKRELYHLEIAAIGGHPDARYNLGNHEGRLGKHERAMKHHIIAAKLGYDRALEAVKKGFQRGWVSKDDYAAALRGHQAAVDATKSQQREEAYKKFRVL